MGKDKKKHKKKSKEHKKRRNKTSKSKHNSDDTTSGSEEWVEESGGAPTIAVSQPPPQPKSPNIVDEQDLWASNPALLACTSREQQRQGKEKKNDKSEQDKYMLDNLGRTDRELNPYWKDGGSGLPEESPATVDSLRQAHVTVGDQGAAWLRKALQRAREQAQDSGRPLAEVVAERWGSLEKLESMIAAAEERGRNRGYKVNDNQRPYNKNDNRDRRHSYENRDRLSFNRDTKCNRDRESNKSFSKPRDSSEDSSSDDKKYKHEKKSDVKYDKDRGRESRKQKEQFKRVKGSSDSNDSSEEEIYKIDKFRKHKREDKDRPYNKFSKPRTSSNSSEEDNERSKRNNYEQERSSKSSSRRFSRPVSSSDEEEKKYRERRGKNNKKELDRDKSSYDSKRKFSKPRHDSDEDKYESKSRSYKTVSSSSGGWRKKVESKLKDEKVKVAESLVKSEEIKEESRSDEGEQVKTPVEEAGPILTDKELNELAAKLVKAELLGNQELADELKGKLARAREAKANAPKSPEGSKEVVILTHTDAKGFTRPVSLSGPVEPTGGRRKGRKVETHAGGKRMRYFADDDKYSLQEMFQREKLNTVEDSNEVFAKLASKGIGRDDSTRDMEDVFEETARVEEGEGRQKARERQKAMEQSRRTARTLDHCQWCLDSPHMLRHLIVAIGSTCYLCVPPYQSLTDHHCLIVPRNHTPCATQLDEDVWAEMQDFRKALVRMFLSSEEDVVFFESARRLNQFPHMLLNCVPVPKETGDMAPIYFKKAIQECEQEWSNNKKLVDLKGRDVRRAVPKGLPYFSVDFGMDSGYAHVIEDEQLFPQNFAQEIIGGMLDLDHSIWRKQRRQTFEEQSKKVIQLTKLWSPFDITKKK